MHVTVEIPDTKGSHLDAAVAKQFAQIQRQLMKLVTTEKQATRGFQTKLLDRLEDQQQTLVGALERLMTLMTRTSKQPDHSNRIVSLLQQMQRAVPTSPTISLKMPQSILHRLDTMQTALLQGLRRSRSRTFGSNY